MQCGRTRKGTNALFCANFGFNRGGYICSRVWCGECYTPHPLDRFPIIAPRDESGFEWLQNDKDALRFCQARNGDHLITPFQCDWCLFRLLTHRIPQDSNRQDQFMMSVLRRCNLDAFWGREDNTVDSNRRSLDQLIRLWDTQLGMHPLSPALGPFPNTDIQGIVVAMGMLLKSLEKGRYKAHTQFETMRKLRSSYYNLYHASSQGAMQMTTLGREKAKAFLSDCPTQSMWFEKFAKGCLKRMGQDVKQDLAVSVRLVLAFVQLLDFEWNRASRQVQWTLALLGAYVCIAFGGSFRGHEVFLTDLHGLLKYDSMDLNSDGVSYVIIPLLGRFKSVVGERYHLTPLVSVTASGIPIGKWTRRLAEVKREQGLTHGPAFSDHRGNRVNSQWLELEILERFQSIQTSHPQIIPEHVNVFEEYGISRSLRRGATTEAKNRKVAENDIDAVNR